MRDSLRQLVLTRFREFMREPEAVFWSLAFPILLTVGLGIAFRNRPAEVVHVGVIGDSTASARAMAALAASKSIAPEHMGDAAARAAHPKGCLL
jgi:ABC-2 type transport system permease protein